MPEPRSYYISCSPADNAAPGRQWTDWLNQAIADFEVPASLPRIVERPPEESGFLVVICSPGAVESQRVADEIRHFKEAGKAHHILAVIVDGEPNAPGKAGNAECLPEPLRFGVAGEDGKIDWKQRVMPLVVDVRPEGRPGQGWTTPAAYREELKKTMTVEKEIVVKAAVYRQRLELAKLKVISGILGVPVNLLQERGRGPAGASAKGLSDSKKAPGIGGVNKPAKPAAQLPRPSPPAASATMPPVMEAEAGTADRRRPWFARGVFLAPVILCVAGAAVIFQNWQMARNLRNTRSTPDIFEQKNPGTHGLGEVRDYTKDEENYENTTAEDNVDVPGRKDAANGSGDAAENVADLQAAADQGDADAQVSLGWTYAQGLGVVRNYLKAAGLFQNAAGQGNAEALYRLGCLYEFGHGFVQSYSKAAELFQKAADKGYADAEYNLGWFYFNGMGVAQSYAKAAELFQKAADQGYAAAQANLGLLHATGRGVAQSYAKAAVLFQKAADQYNADAQYNLGVLYASGMGVERNYAKAAALYQQAAGQGNAAAMNNLGVLYENGQGVAADLNRAREFYEKAAAQGNENAKNSIARLNQAAK